eukprot:GFUD01014120.1.p1 GENE.GFUD01014120.1~~GFUD01014120.1.p1  ORF type:complete len:546 (+),score=96.50 GFUD01014120.1:55-1692(+)
MARNRFPGKPAKMTLPKRQRVISKKFGLNKENLLLNENVSRGIHCFYAMIGDSDEEEDFHGFTEKEIKFANLKSEYLQAQAKLHREAFWAAKGIALDPDDREEIRRNSGGTTYQSKPLRLSNGGSSHKKKGLKIQPNIESPSQNQNCPIKKQELKRDSSGKFLSPKNRNSVSMTFEEINQMHFEENLRKPKTEIQLPGWRRIESPHKSQNRVEISDVEDVEDMSDIAFAIRHAKAEEEEQELWEKWQAKRLEDGSLPTGRSKSSGWREPDLNLPKLRSQRVSSLKSECSTPGRLSPATVERVKEICIEPSTPPYIMNSLHKAFDKHDLVHKMSDETFKTPDKTGSNLTMFENTCHRGPRTRIQDKFRNSIGNGEKESLEGEGTNNALFDDSKEISSCLITSKVIKYDQENLIKGDPPIVRRSKSDTHGMRRSTPRDENGTDSNMLKNTKENIACQLMNLSVSSSENLKNSLNSINRLSESSARSNSADAMNRVLKDSNVEKGMLVHQTSRQATKKTILSQKSIHRNSYPLRSQSLTRRTRQGVKR